MKRYALLLILAVATLCIPGSAWGYTLRREGVAEKIGYADGDTLLVVPAKVRMIPPYAFTGCEGLRRVVFEPGSRCARISEFAFAECRDLEVVELPPSVAYIGDGAFRGCVALRTIPLSPLLQQISRETFAGCISLNGITLPESLREIKPLAFLDCRSLELDAIPAKVGKIGNNAFCRCVSLTDMTLPRRCGELGSYAFADCTQLKRITLPASCRMLGELIFSGCVRLREIVSPAVVPPIIECNSSLFEPDDARALRDCRIIVPKGRAEAYRTSPWWEKFRSIED